MKARGQGGVFQFEGFRLDRQSRVLFRRDEAGAFVPMAVGSRALRTGQMQIRTRSELEQSKPVQPRRTLLRSDPADAADPRDADPLLSQQRSWPAGAAVQPVTLKDSERAECGLKIFGIAVGLLILMAIVAA